MSDNPFDPDGLPEEFPEELKQGLQGILKMLGGKVRPMPGGLGIELGGAKEEENGDDGWEFHASLSGDALQAYQESKVEVEKLEELMKETIKQKAKVDSFKKHFWGLVEKQTGIYDENLKIDPETHTILIKRKKPEDKESGKKE